jgi:hypothetical protein
MIGSPICPVYRRRYHQRLLVVKYLGALMSHMRTLETAASLAI